jgi:hypothetical protein
MGHFELAAVAFDRLSQEERFEIKKLFTLVMASILEIKDSNMIALSTRMPAAITASKYQFPNPIEQSIVKSLTCCTSASHYRRFSNAGLKPALDATIDGRLLPKNSPLIPPDPTSQSSQA